jgi:hypothetical protein
MRNFWVILFWLSLCSLLAGAVIFAVHLAGKKAAGFRAGILLALTGAIGVMFTFLNYNFVEVYPEGDTLSPGEAVRLHAQLPFLQIYYTPDGASVRQDGILYEKEILPEGSADSSGKAVIGYSTRLFGLWLNPDEKVYQRQSGSAQPAAGTAYVNDTAGFYDTDGDSVYLHAGTKIILRTASGCYLSPDNSGRFYADKTEIDDSCQLRIDTTEDSYTGFWHVMTGTYASAQSFLPPYELACGKHEMQAWECFRLSRNEEFVRIISQGRENTGSAAKYLTCAEDQPGKPVYARAEKAQAWENFSVFVWNEAHGRWENLFTEEYLN